MSSGRKAYIPLRVGAVRSRDGGRQKTTRKLRHNVDPAHFTLSDCLGFAGQFLSKTVRDCIAGTRDQWQVSPQV